MKNNIKVGVGFIDLRKSIDKKYNDLHNLIKHIYATYQFEEISFTKSGMIYIRKKDEDGNFSCRGFNNFDEVLTYLIQ